MHERSYVPVEHSIVVPWAYLCDWIRDADSLAGYDGTFDFAAHSVGRFDGVLAAPTEADVEKGWAAADRWLLATAEMAEA